MYLIKCIPPVHTPLSTVYNRCIVFAHKIAFILNICIFLHKDFRFGKLFYNGAFQ